MTVFDSKQHDDPPVTYGTCPRCGENTLRTDRPVMNALSRTDNATYVCSACGTSEALEDYMHPGAYVMTKDDWKAPFAAPPTLPTAS